MTATPSSAPNPPERASRVARAAVARERVHAMESLAAIIGHELRAGVLGVTSAAQLLRYSVPEDPIVEKSLGKILQEAERLSALHEALTEYATELPPRFADGDPDAVWSQVAGVMRGALEAKSALLRLSGPALDVTLRLDEEQLGRAFERLIHHALSRVNSGAELDIVSSIDDDRWVSTISAAPDSLIRSDGDRASFLLILAQRALVAHGGEIIDHRGDAAPLLVTVRLPLSQYSE